MIIKIIKNIKKIINSFIEKPSIIMFLVNIFNLFNKKEEIKYVENKKEEKKEEEEYYLKIIIKCNHCNSVIGSEMYCYKDNYYCSELCRTNYYE